MGTKKRKTNKNKFTQYKKLGGHPKHPYPDANIFYWKNDHDRVVNYLVNQLDGDIYHDTQNKRNFFDTPEFLKSKTYKNLMATNKAKLKLLAKQNENEIAELSTKYDSELSYCHSSLEMITQKLQKMKNAETTRVKSRELLANELRNHNSNKTEELHRLLNE